MRLIALGNVIVDIVTRVQAVPEPGGDVLATSSGMSPGGSFNTMFAAVSQGLPTAYAGGHGTGFFGDLIRRRLAETGIVALLEPFGSAGSEHTVGRQTDGGQADSGQADSGQADAEVSDAGTSESGSTDSGSTDSGSTRSGSTDSGYDVALIDDSGERTFITSFGAEARLDSATLAGIVVDPDDYLYLSGYALLDQTNGAVIAPWLDGLDPRVRVLLDPGPLVADIRPEVWEAALTRADWLSCNEREARLITGERETLAAVEALATQSAGVLVRLGEHGCIVAVGGVVQTVPGFVTDVVDTNGAGDAHAGAFLAALAAGLDPFAAAGRANACAALAVSRRGPATAPTLAETLEFIRASVSPAP
jgi:sugar/nucleoside kinase (ribokinase family)